MHLAHAPRGRGRSGTRSSARSSASRPGPARRAPRPWGARRCRAAGRKIAWRCGRDPQALGPEPLGELVDRSSRATPYQQWLLSSNLLTIAGRRPGRAGPAAPSRTRRPPAPAWRSRRSSSRGSPASRSASHSSAKRPDAMSSTQLAHRGGEVEVVVRLAARQLAVLARRRVVARTATAYPRSRTSRIVRSDLARQHELGDDRLERDARARAAPGRTCCSRASSAGDSTCSTARSRTASWQRRQLDRALAQPADRLRDRERARLRACPSRRGGRRPR